MIVSLLGCAGSRFNFTPAYNLQTARMSEDAMNYFDTTYAKMIASPDKTYVLFAPDYLRGEQMINSIFLADSLRPYAAKPLFITNNIKVYFLAAELDHKTKGILTNGQLRAYKGQLHRLFEPLVVEENYLINKK